MDPLTLHIEWLRAVRDSRQHSPLMGDAFANAHWGAVLSCVLHGELARPSAPPLVRQFVAQRVNCTLAPA